MKNLLPEMETLVAIVLALMPKAQQRRTLEALLGQFLEAPTGIHFRNIVNSSHQVL